jgi:hypothetical protein
MPPHIPPSATGARDIGGSVEGAPAPGLSQPSSRIAVKARIRERKAIGRSPSSAIFERLA